MYYLFIYYYFYGIRLCSHCFTNTNSLNPHDRSMGRNEYYAHHPDMGTVTQKA